MQVNENSFLPNFLKWLMATFPTDAPSQSAIARRCGVSQSEIYKILSHTHTKPRLPTIQKITLAYWTEWQQYLTAHRQIREALALAYRWTRYEPVLTVAELRRRMKESRPTSRQQQ